jgi:uncharacterized cofD-like protein
MKNSYWESLKKWLAPGMNVKRWILVIIFGFGLIGISLLAIVDFAQLGSVKRWMIDFLIDVFGKNRLYTPSWYSVLIGTMVLVGSVAVVVYGIRQLISSIITSLMPEHEKEVADIVREYRFRSKMLNIAIIGGGTGIFPYLQAMKELPFTVSAIVTVSDSGGSSGKLRQEYAIPAPGDIRRALIALSEHKSSYLENLFNYRFSEGSLSGHNIGNLMITGLTEMTGDFSESIYQLSKILAVKGNVIPFTLENLTLCAEFDDNTIATGEAEIRKTKKKIQRIFFDPQYTKPLIRVIEAIDKADIILIGPGSLYTSILPSLIITPISDIIERSDALKIFSVNLMTEVGETDNYTVSKHISSLFDNTGYRIANYVLVNNGKISDLALEKYARYNSTPVEQDIENVRNMGITPLFYDLVEENDDYIRHSSVKVKQAIINIVNKARYIKGKKVRL